MDNVRARLLEVWSPPNGAGDPVGLIATTYTFDGVFFEEECLGRFLNIQSNANADGPFYLIELEEKLSGLFCVSLLVDAHHCSGSRNLRWDLIPARVKEGGVFHPKITILHWASAIRLIIGSANITENGYRENQETFSYLDISTELTVHSSVLYEVLDFLVLSINEVTGRRERPDTARYREFVQRIKNTIGIWSAAEGGQDPVDLKIRPLFVYPGSTNIFEQLRIIWEQNCRGVPSHAVITSPFYNSPTDEFNPPAREIWKILNRRGAVMATYNVPVDDFTSSFDSLVIAAPRSLLRAVPDSRQGAKAEFNVVYNMIQNGGEQNIRPFHFKSICLKNSVSMIYCIGSSNFTSAGTGMMSRPNFEANLAFIIRDDPKSYKAIEEARIKGKPIRGDFEFQKGEKPNDDEAGSDEYLPLPLFFESAVFIHAVENKLMLCFAEGPPSEFRVLTLEDEELLNEQGWRKNGGPGIMTLSWSERPLLSGLKVTWKESRGSAFWPVVVEDRNSLPPPEDLKDLPLELLIRIITSSRPMHQIVGNWLLKKKNEKVSDRFEIEEILDPHRRVDTTSYLLQRTRRISYALHGLRQRLEKPVYTMESLRWRLRGPIGVLALSRAVIQEAGSGRDRRSDDEIAFLLAEIALELSRIKYKETSNSLTAKQVFDEIMEVIKELHQNIRPHLRKLNPEMKAYIRSAYKASVR